MTHDTGAPPELITGLLPAADHSLVRTVDALSDSQYAEPSQLPGWSRAHVVAHLTLNAEALGGVLHAAHTGRQRPMYASDEARDADIESLAASGPSEVRDRFLASTTFFGDALAAMHEHDWAGSFDRTPGVRTVRLVDVPLMRVREVEIHHADLGVGHTAEDWSPDFCAVLLESLTRVDPGVSFEVRPTDLDRTWRYGQDDGGPVITGRAGAIGWWLTGRGTGAGLTSDTGALPEMEAW
ncbi:maleylpyruvate isomerase family mycothiol-dependent enzyme [Nocardioides oleivorans]|uniref:maleylpyruvate isomerase family mycothiol-dependent enzyme n=1 Tax=Nocardioides oleivorans TaxID=273676 RepID=UPI0013EE0700|nr:maleylpyruvate isomerase family mycothiol-dependent enzyme [Nocardioides oleivorans]